MFERIVLRPFLSWATVFVAVCAVLSHSGELAAVAGGCAMLRDAFSPASATGPGSCSRPD